MKSSKVNYTPLYLQVKDILLQRIRENVYQKGRAIPSEATLAQDLGTSTTTIRQAISVLAAEGVLVKKPGKGTFVAEQKTSISFFSWIPETTRGESILRDMLDVFHHKHPSLCVECIPTSYPQAKRELLKLITSGNAPDVAQIQTHWTSYFASSGAFVKLESLLEKENLVNRFYEKDLAGGSYRDSLYSVAWGLCPMTMIANKQMLKEAGIAQLDIPLTLDRFQKICRELDRVYQAGERYSYAISVLKDETDFLFLYSFLQAFKGRLTDEQGNIVFHSPENLQAFLWLRDFVESCRVLITDIYTIRKRFAHGDIAFMSDGPWIKYQLEEYTGEDFDKNFQVVLNPVSEGQPSYSWNDNHALAICAQSRHASSAATFIDAVTNDPEISNEYYSKVGHLPANKHSLDHPVYSSEFYQAYKRQLTHASCINAQNALFGKAMDFCTDSVKRILFEGVDIQTELEEKAHYLEILYS